jgi:hypothetical protein
MLRRALEGFRQSRGHYTSGVGSAPRRWLGERLRELFALKLHRAFLLGSYVTAKKSLNDLDSCLPLERIAPIPFSSGSIWLT